MDFGEHELLQKWSEENDGELKNLNEEIANIYERIALLDIKIEYAETLSKGKNFKGLVKDLIKERINEFKGDLKEYREYLEGLEAEAQILKAMDEEIKDNLGKLKQKA